MENAGNGKLFVFIGEKIEVKELLDEKGSMDAKFLAKYKILEKICGNYWSDTVEFIVYDHYGTPAFEEFKTVMLYISEYEGKYYHEKYQYNALYKTKDGRWASPFNLSDHDSVDTADMKVKPVKINFAQEVSFPTYGFKKREIRESFPEPFYNIVDGKAIAVYGNYVEELFELKKRGVLRARGLFGEADTTAPILLDVVLEEFDNYSITAREKKMLLITWSELLMAIEGKNSGKIKELSLDSVICSVCEGFSSPHFYNDVEPIDTFISASYSNFSNFVLWDHMKRNEFKMSATKYSITKPPHFPVPKRGGLIIYEVIFKTVTIYGQTKYQNHHSFQFVKVKGRFTFYGMVSH
jgi:hypothetical protein